MLTPLLLSLAAIMHGSIINNTASLHTDDILISGAGDDFNTAEISKSSILFSLITSQNERQYIEVYSIDGNINLCNYMISVYNGKFSFSPSNQGQADVKYSCVLSGNPNDDNFIITINDADSHQK